MSELVGRWNVPLSGGSHVVELEHGSISGRRVIRVDGVEIYRRDWLFTLSGTEHFVLEKTRCSIRIEADRKGFGFQYTLSVNGKPLEQFTENQKKVMQCWHSHVRGEPFRIVLENRSLDVWVNGQRVPSVSEFTDLGSEIHFSVTDYPAIISASSTGRRRDGIVYRLQINGADVQDNPPPADN